MKLEKREISLNEYDSLRDMFRMQKALLHQYADVFCVSVSKQTRNQLIEQLKAVCQDTAQLLDRLQAMQEQES